MNVGKKAQTHEYLTVLLRRRSVIAHCCGILTLALAFYGIIAGVNSTIVELHRDGFVSFTYYTMISNTLAALSMAFVFPYTIEGMRNKRFTMPKWVAVVHYVVTTSIVITMVFTLAFISWISPADAFGGSNLVKHVICPLLILFSFLQMENGTLFTWKDRLLGVVPFCVYMIVYYIEVEVIGQANGGWADIYRIKEFAPLPLAMLILMPLAFGVSTGVALLSDHLTKKRNEKMYRLWSEELDPAEARIEAYAIGRMAALNGEMNNIQIPYDVLTCLAEKYGLDTETLMKSFVKGVMIGLKDR